MMHTKFNIVTKIGFKLICVFTPMSKTQSLQDGVLIVSSTVSSIVFPWSLASGQDVYISLVLTRGQNGVLMLLPCVQFTLP